MGWSPASYPAPVLEYGATDEPKRVLGKTLGVPLFQEQAMRLAIIANGFPREPCHQLGPFGLRPGADRP